MWFGSGERKSISMFKDVGVDEAASAVYMRGMIMTTLGLR